MDSLKKEFEDQKNELQKGVADTKESFNQSIDSCVKKAKRFTKKLMWSLLVLGVIAILGFILWADYTHSEGTRAGDLIKISKKGYVFKTHEGQLKLGGIDLSNPEEGLSDTWSFSVKHHHIVNKLESLQGKKVVLRYEEKNYALPWQGDTNYFIIDVQESKE